MAAAPASEGFTEPLRAPAMIDVPPLPISARVAPSSPSMHGALALLDDHGDVRPLEEIEAEVDPLRHRALSRADVGGRAAVADRPLHALPQARKSRPRGARSEGRKDERKEPAEAH